MIHFIDNAGAMASLVKDDSRDVDSARLVHTFWALSAALELDVWFEFVYSEANLADWPSRGCLDFVEPLGAIRVPVVIPQSDSWGDVELILGMSQVDEALPPKKRRRH